MFVGRKRELHFGVTAIKNGFHLIVHGPYGIGKTAYAQELVRRLERPSVFLSVEMTPNEMAREVCTALDPEKETSLRLSFRGLQRRLRDVLRCKPLVVVDDIYALSTAKAGFLRFLMDYGARIIFVVDLKAPTVTFKTIANFRRLTKTVTLDRLTPQDTLDLCRDLAEKTGDPDLVVKVTLSWVRMLGGYPLLIVEKFQRRKA